MNGIPNNNIRSILYTGSLHKFAGIMELIDSLSALVLMMVLMPIQVSKKPYTTSMTYQQILTTRNWIAAY